MSIQRLPFLEGFTTFILLREYTSAASQIPHRFWPVRHTSRISAAPFLGAATARGVMPTTRYHLPDLLCRLQMQDLWQLTSVGCRCGHALTNTLLYSRCSCMHGLCVFNGILSRSAETPLHFALFVLLQY